MKTKTIYYEDLSVDMFYLETRNYKVDWRYNDELIKFLKDEKGITLDAELRGSWFLTREMNFVEIRSMRRYLNAVKGFELTHTYIQRDICDTHIQKFLNQTLKYTSSYYKIQDVFAVAIVYNGNIVDVIICLFITDGKILKSSSSARLEGKSDMKTKTIYSDDKKYANLSVDMAYLEIAQHKIEWRSNDELMKFLKDEKGIILEDKIDSGGFGEVFAVNNTEVVKITSLRKYLNVVGESGFGSDESYIHYGIYNKHIQKFLNEIYVHKRMTGASGFPETYDAFAVSIIFAGNTVDVIACIRMKRYEKVNYKKLNESEILRVARDVLECLEKAHSYNLVNRDIKDENIMFDFQKKRYVLIDWGVAKVFNQATTTTAKYSDGYIAPERAKQIEKMSFSETNVDRDPRIDIYSVGVLLYYWANKCGKLPLRYEKRIGVLNPSYKKIRQVSERYENVMKRALNKNPEKRFQSAAEMKSVISVRVPCKPNPYQQDKEIENFKGKETHSELFKYIRDSALLLVLLCLVGFGFYFTSTFCEYMNTIRQETGGTAKEMILDFVKYKKSIGNTQKYIESAETSKEKLVDFVNNEIIWERFIESSYSKDGYVHKDTERNITGVEADNQVAIGSTLPEVISLGETIPVQFKISTSSLPESIMVFGLNDKNILHITQFEESDLQNGVFTFDYTLNAQENFVDKPGEYRVRVYVDYSKTSDNADFDKKWEEFYMDTYVNVVSGK